MNTGGFATLHVCNKYFGGFAVNSTSGFASNEKVEIHILDTILDILFTILVYVTIFYKMDVSTKITAIAPKSLIFMRRYEVMDFPWHGGM